MYRVPLDAVTSRVQPAYRPLMYQWALHLISVLPFLHERHIILGDYNLGHFWLSSDPHLSVSLVGFVNAGSWRRSDGMLYSCSRTSGKAFHALKIGFHKYTTQTDLFLYGCIVYELMTGFWPGDRMEKSRQEIEIMISRKEWPVLETEHMGEIVRKCWNGEFEDAEQVKVEVVAFLERLGWSITGNDDLEGFDVTGFGLDLLVEMRNSRGR
jgi:serine/threonine protein kinase